MKAKIKKKPRIFKVGKDKKIKIKDYGKILLSPDEQITLVTKDLSKHDITRKSWGFYATQSVNKRLKKRFKTAVVINQQKKIYIMLVEKKYKKNFDKYCKEENQKVLFWLDEFKNTKL